MPDHHGEGNLHVVRCLYYGLLRQSRAGWFVPRDLGQLLKSAEVRFDPDLSLLRVKVSCDHKAGVVWDVPALKEAHHIVNSRRHQVLVGTDDGVTVGVVGRVERGCHRLPDDAIWRVFDGLTTLVSDHVALEIQLLLSHRASEVSHPIGLHPQERLEQV